jgi:hypothetical protein
LTLTTVATPPHFPAVLGRDPAYMARAIREAVRTMPAYTFTAEGSRAHRAMHGSTSLSPLLKAKAVNNYCKHGAGNLTCRFLWQGASRSQRLSGRRGFPRLRFAIQTVLNFAGTLHNAIAVQSRSSRADSNHPQTCTRREKIQRLPSVLCRLFALPGETHHAAQASRKSRPGSKTS